MKRILISKTHYFTVLTFTGLLFATVACAGGMQKEGSMSKTGMMKKEMAMDDKMAMKDSMHGIGVDQDVVGIRGYDPVAYFDQNQAVPGSGFHTSTHEGVTYLFTSKANQEKFAATPKKFVPAYGGYCAYGVAVGKKFHSDPRAWKIVDGKLYLNLDKKIQSKWNEDVSGYIQKAQNNWKGIEGKHPSKL